MPNIRSTSEKIVGFIRNRYIILVICREEIHPSRRMNSFYAVDRPVHLSNLLLFYVSDAYQIRSRRLDPLYEFDVLLS